MCSLPSSLLVLPPVTAMTTPSWAVCVVASRTATILCVCVRCFLRLPCFGSEHWLAVQHVQTEPGSNLHFSGELLLSCQIYGIHVPCWMCFHHITDLIGCALCLCNFLIEFKDWLQYVFACPCLFHIRTDVCKVHCATQPICYCTFLPQFFVVF